MHIGDVYACPGKMDENKLNSLQSHSQKSLITSWVYLYDLLPPSVLYDTAVELSHAGRTYRDLAWGKSTLTARRTVSCSTTYINMYMRTPGRWKGTSWIPFQSQSEKSNWKFGSLVWFLPAFLADVRHSSWAFGPPAVLHFRSDKPPGGISMVQWSSDLTTVPSSGTRRILPSGTSIAISVRILNNLWRFLADTLAPPHPPQSSTLDSHPRNSATRGQSPLGEPPQADLQCWKAKGGPLELDPLLFFVCLVSYLVAYCFHIYQSSHPTGTGIGTFSPS